jgi:hypothetical protein
MESINAAPIEPGLYVGAVALFVVGLLFGLNAAQILVVLAGVGVAAIVVPSYLWWTSVPPDWRRYVKVSRPLARSRAW